MAIKMLYDLRCYVAKWVYYLGYRMMPARIRKGVNTINAIGLKWIEVGCPENFILTIETIKTATAEHE